MTVDTQANPAKHELFRDLESNHLNAKLFQTEFVTPAQAQFSHSEADTEELDKLVSALYKLSLSSSSPSSSAIDFDKEEVFTEETPDEYTRWATIYDSLSTREVCNARENDETAWFSMGSPDLDYRVCRDENQNVISVWTCYPDIKDLFPENHTFTRSPTLSELERKKWDFVDFPGRGKGLQANHYIARGETILRETPLFMTTLFMCFSSLTDPNPYEAQEERAKMAFDHLQPADKARFLELSNCKEGKYPILERRETNELACCFHQPEAKLRMYGGICPTTCRVNHSCDPNSEYKFICKEVVVELRAIRPIAKGEEITLTYCDTLDDHATRQAELLHKYNFACRCRVCSIPRSAILESNTRRDQISHLSHNAVDYFYTWFTSQGNTSTESLIRMYQTFLVLLDEECMDEGRGIPVRWLANLYAALGDTKLFKRWAKEAAEYIPIMSTPHGFCDGEVWKGWLEDPSTHPLWNLRRQKREM